MRKSNVLIGLFILFFVHLADAFKPINIDDKTKEFQLINDYYEILEDPSGNLNIYDIITDSINRKFVLNQEYYNYNKNTSSAYWIKFKVVKQTGTEASFVFESYSTHTKNLQLFVPSKRGHFNIHKAGLDYSFKDRDYIHQNLVFDLNIPEGQETVCYVRVYSDNHSAFEFRIKSNNYFSFYSTNEYYYLGIFYGILLIMAVYNLLLFFSIKDKVYLYYVFYVLSCMLSTLADDGLGLRYIWPAAQNLDNFIGHILAPNLLLLSFLFYANEFLSINTKHTVYYNYVKYATILYIVYFIVEKIFLPDFVQIRVFYLLPFLTVYAISIICFFKGQLTARYFIIGYTFIFLSIIIIQLRASGTIEGNIFTVYSFNYGLVFEVVVFSFGLSERIKHILKEKEEAQFGIIDQLEKNNKLQEKINKQLEENNLLQEKVNRELEAKVNERTEEIKHKNAELEETNAKLKEMTERANSMAAKLDLDNWNLQKYVKEEIKARISDQEVPYDEFIKIFPNEHACFKFLDDLKWKDNSFGCRKCKNVKFIKGIKPFSRKCTRCGYVESVTAYTLFHGVRFEVDKAFYMTYIVHRRGTKITLDQLSDLLQLRRNTCWNFKKKILSTIDEYKISHSKNPEHWEDIILEN